MNIYPIDFYSIHHPSVCFLRNENYRRSKKNKSLSIKDETHTHTHIYIL